MYFLGVDVGTQSMKACVLSQTHKQDKIEIVSQVNVSYDSECPKFGTHNGILSDGAVVTAPTLMFVQAFELLLEKIPKQYREGLVSISGSAQQHGSIYVRKHKDGNLWNRYRSRTDGNGVYKLVSNDFNPENGPIWMDSSTTEICRKLEELVGGPEELMKITGSSAHERFTASQIVKFSQKEANIDQCERICLISSFFTSYLTGKYEYIDLSDGSGMNMLDISTMEWSNKVIQTICELSGKHLTNTVLEELIGKQLVPSNSIVGKISEEVALKFNINPSCKVCSFSGDNQNSSCAILTSQNDVCVSLGTSHTIFGLMDNAGDVKNTLEGHVFINPNYDPFQTESFREFKYLYLLCFKNGGMIRSNFCSRYCNNDWNLFEAMLVSSTELEKSVISNGKHAHRTIKSIHGFYFEFMEITPKFNTTGYYRYVKFEDSNGFELVTDEEFTEILSYSRNPNTIQSLDIKSLVYSQFMSLKVHAKINGLSFNKGNMIVTGGGSNSKALMQVLSNVFCMPVQVVPEAADSTTTGAALRALFCHHGEKVSSSNQHSFHSVTMPLLPALQVVARPAKLEATMEDLINEYLYTDLERQLCQHYK